VPGKRPCPTWLKTTSSDECPLSGAEAGVEPGKGQSRHSVDSCDRDGGNSALLRIFGSVWLPGASAEQIKWYANLLRLSTSVENAIKNRVAAEDIDILDLLPKVSAPTLVLHCRNDNAAPFDEGRGIATFIPNAEFVTLDSENHVPIPSEPAWSQFIGEIEAFLLRI
jgi:pimeloyl-ACP methyl ester carboxylesterase